MATKKRNRTKAPNRALTDQLNVRVPTELFRRVSSVAGAKGDTLAKFVIEALDERTKDHQTDVQRIADREQSPRKWQ
jgi:predicted HicB family RNase H-like nuclease